MTRLQFASHLLTATVISCVFLLALPAGADEVSSDQVRLAAETWVRNFTPDARPAAKITSVDPLLVDGQLVAYVAQVDEGGFCLCGADDLGLPVYLYNPFGPWDDAHPGYIWVVTEIANTTAALRNAARNADPSIEAYEPLLAKRSQSWRDLAAGYAPVDGDDAPLRDRLPGSLELPLLSKWSQHWPYNDVCPMGDGGQCVVGCVATATVQIMRYWRWPSAGSGSHSYTWNGDQSCDGDGGGGTLSAAFADSFDWANMPYEAPEDGYTPAQQAALSELSYEIGVGLEMDYGVCGSSAFTSNIENMLQDHFYYDNDARYDSANISDLTTELGWSRPVAMRGDRWDGQAWIGHCFVVYGYDTGTDPDRSFLINMGWGLSDWHVWYRFDSIPYTNDKHYVRRIAPETYVRFVGATSDGDGTPDDPYRDITEALAEAPNGSRLIFEAGSTHTYTAGDLVIDRPLTLSGIGVTITSN